MAEGVSHSYIGPPVRIPDPETENLFNALRLLLSEVVINDALPLNCNAVQRAQVCLMRAEYRWRIK